jgi:hypothetical protein
MTAPIEELRFDSVLPLRPFSRGRRVSQRLGDDKSRLCIVAVRFETHDATLQIL